MPYRMNEGVLAVDAIADRSINIITVTGPDGSPLSVVITRDECEPGEDAEGSVTRQLNALERQTQDFKQLSRKRVELGAGQHPTIVLESRFKQSGQTVYQSQAVMERPDRQMIIFTLNSLVPIDQPLRDAWIAILESFTPG